MTDISEIETAFGVDVIGESADSYIGEDSRAYHFIDGSEKRLVLPKEGVDLDHLEEMGWVTLYE